MANDTRRAVRREDYLHPKVRDALFADRLALLRLVQDLDPKTKRIRESKTYDAPIGGVRAEPRKCSKCSQPTIFTTPRGRSVHPACEGWVDDLDQYGEVELMYAVMAALPIKSVEVQK